MNHKRPTHTHKALQFKSPGKRDLKESRLISVEKRSSCWWPNVWKQQKHTAVNSTDFEPVWSRIGDREQRSKCLELATYISRSVPTMCMDTTLCACGPRGKSYFINLYLFPLSFLTLFLLSYTFPSCWNFFPFLPFSFVFFFTSRLTITCSSLLLSAFFFLSLYLYPFLLLFIS